MFVNERDLLDHLNVHTGICSMEEREIRVFASIWIQFSYEC